MSWYTYTGFGDEIDKDIANQMDVMESLGIRYIEPRGVNGINVSRLTIDEAKEVKAQFDKRGFRVSAIGSPIGKINITNSYDDDLKLFAHVLDLADVFETKYIRIFSCLLPEGDDPKKHREEVLRRMGGYVNAARGREVILLHENEGGGIYGQSPKCCLDIFESVGSEKLRATFDPGNFVYAGFDALEAYEILENFIEYVHIKDSVGNKVIVPAGHGKVQFSEIFKRLKKTGKSYFLSLEPHLSSFEGFAQIDGGNVKLKKGNNKEKFILAFNCLKDLVDDMQ